MDIHPVVLARPDIAELLHVERNSLGDSDLSVDEALAVLGAPAHLCLGAYINRTLVGFLSCFETYAPAGPRLELDMLGVLPAHRNQGVATALIGAGVEKARERGCATARAIVRTDNPASLAAFRRAGLAVQGEVTMLIWDKASRETTRPPRLPVTQRIVSDPVRAHLRANIVSTAHGGDAVSATTLDVSTLAYRGRWVESLAGRSAAACAALATAIGETALVDNLLEAGLLLPVGEGPLARALHKHGWQEAGAFYSLSWSA